MSEKYHLPKCHNTKLFHLHLFNIAKNLPFGCEVQYILYLEFFKREFFTGQYEDRREVIGERRKCISTGP